MAFLTGACWLLEFLYTTSYMRQQSPRFPESSKATTAAIPAEIQHGTERVSLQAAQNNTDIGFNHTTFLPSNYCLEKEYT